MPPCENQGCIRSGENPVAPIITLLTDFGDRDYYVGAMKGVLLRYAPGAQIIDLTHTVPPQDVLAGSFVLAHAASEFPAHTVHLAVVDPGVGTMRRALAVRGNRGTFIAPDNGLLDFVLRDPASQARAIVHPDLRAARVSCTFHGRDLLAPAAARLAAGFPFVTVGPVVEDAQMLPIRSATVRAGLIEGHIIHVDRFGSLITNIAAADLPPELDRVRVRLHAGQTAVPFCRTYADVPDGERLSLIGSAGLLEIAVRNGSAAGALRLGRGDPVQVELVREAIV